jgi:putative addiction module antidote
MIPLKLTQIGNSTGVVLPKEALEKMHVGKGDVIYLTEAPDGFRVTPYDPQFANQMEAAADIMKRYRNTLKILAQ